VLEYKRVRKPLREISQRLGVDYIVEGTISRSGGRVRITAQLIELVRVAEPDLMAVVKPRYRNNVC
jgi:TolB-like protein